MISFNNNMLIVDIDKIIEFQYEIENIIIYEKIIIVLLEIPQKRIFNENIFGVFLDGKISWQIQKITPEDHDSPYVSIKKSANGLDAFNWSGIKARVNLMTGEVMHKRITK